MTDGLLAMKREKLGKTGGGGKQVWTMQLSQWSPTTSLERGKPKKLEIRTRQQPKQNVGGGESRSRWPRKATGVCVKTAR